MKTLKKALVTLILVIVASLGLASCNKEASSSSSSVVVSEAASSVVVDLEQKAVDAAAKKYLLSAAGQKSVTTDFTVLSKITEYEKEVILTWSSDHDDVAKVGTADTDGNINISINGADVDTTVKLTLTASIGSKTSTNVFTFIVPKSNVVTTIEAWNALTAGDSINIIGTITELDTKYSWSTEYPTQSFTFKFNEADTDTGYVYGLDIATQEEADKFLPGAVISIKGSTFAIYNGLKEAKKGTYTIVSEAPLDQDLVDVKAGAAALVNPFAEDGYETVDSTMDITLPSVATDLAVTYESSSSLIVIDGSKATINGVPTVGKLSVKVTATVSKNGKTATSKFYVNLGVKGDVTDFVTFNALEDNTEIIAKNLVITKVVVDDYENISVYATFSNDTNEFQIYKINKSDDDAKLLAGAIINVDGKKSSYHEAVQFAAGAVYEIVTEASLDFTAVNFAAAELVNPFEAAYTEAASGIVLPGVSDDLSVSYESDMAQVVISGLNADIVLPTEGQVTVTVTATVTKGDFSATKDFTVKVGTPAVTAGLGLYISTYYEGAGQDKYISITNSSAADIDLSAYAINLYSNGSLTVNTQYGITQLTGILPAGETFVIFHKEASGTIKTTVNATYTMDSAYIGFNGDDAITLVKGDEVIDYFGTIGNAKDNKIWENQVFVRNEAPTVAVTEFNEADWTATAI